MCIILYLHSIAYLSVSDVNRISEFTPPSENLSVKLFYKTTGSHEVSFFKMIRIVLKTVIEVLISLVPSIPAIHKVLIPFLLISHIIYYSIEKL